MKFNGVEKADKKLTLYNNTNSNIPDACWVEIPYTAIGSRIRTAQ